LLASARLGPNHPGLCMCDVSIMCGGLVQVVAPSFSASRQEELSLCAAALRPCCCATKDSAVITRFTAMANRLRVGHGTPPAGWACRLRHSGLWRLPSAMAPMRSSGITSTSRGGLTGVINPLRHFHSQPPTRAEPSGRSAVAAGPGRFEREPLPGPPLRWTAWTDP
jgi:hypothetical protein